MSLRQVYGRHSAMMTVNELRTLLAGIEGSLPVRIVDMYQGAECEADKAEKDVYYRETRSGEEYEAPCFLISGSSKIGE